MARLNTNVQSDSDDEEFPDVSSLLKRGDWWEGEGSEGRGSIEGVDYSGELGRMDTQRDEKRVKKSRALGIRHVDSLLLPIVMDRVRENLRDDLRDEKRSSPKKAGKNCVDRTFSPWTTSNAAFSDDVFFDDISALTVDDPARNLDEPPSRIRTVRGKVSTNADLVRSISKLTVTDLTSPKKSSTPPSVKNSNVTPPGEISEVSGTVLDEVPEECLRFSPPRSRRVHRSTDKSTPPSSPSKPRLHSPSKKVRIPPSPHRPSIDAFWSQEVINDWNDQHSPRKTPHIERARRLISIGEDDESEPSPSASPRPSPIKSPAKANKEATQRRKRFDEKKHQLATSFLTDVDEKITGGQIAALAASAGGIHVVWSKKLRSTAGRANWKRETLRSKNVDGNVSTTTQRHHASIELAEKIIDDEDRLYNTIAHEYCHLANFMISGIKANPHGKEFKEWASKVTASFSHLGIHVTTKHTYSITYKYIWVCTNALCGVEYKRHSRSIDPATHRCGKCRGALVQLKPVPRSTAVTGAITATAQGLARDGSGSNGPPPGTEEPGRKKNRYQEYVAMHFAHVRRENPHLGMAGWMVELGRGFREERERGKEDGGGGKDGGKDGGGVDAVARKLEFLNVGG